MSSVLDRLNKIKKPIEVISAPDRYNSVMEEMTKQIRDEVHSEELDKARLKALTAESERDIAIARKTAVKAETQVLSKQISHLESRLRDKIRLLDDTNKTLETYKDTSKLDEALDRVRALELQLSEVTGKLKAGKTTIQTIKPEPVSFSFKPERDMNGYITNVIATPIGLN